MKSLSTEIIIQSTREKVWKILTGFNAYGEWNPFIREISGDLKVGAEITVTMSIEGRATSTFKPTVLSVVENEKFCWQGKLILPGIFQGTHYFLMEEFEEGKIKFEQGENFKGLFAGMILRKIGEQTLEGFKKMNQALKEKAES